MKGKGLYGPDSRLRLATTESIFQAQGLIQESIGCDVKNIKSDFAPPLVVLEGINGTIHANCTTAAEGHQKGRG